MSCVVKTTKQYFFSDIAVIERSLYTINGEKKLIKSTLVIRMRVKFRFLTCRKYWLT